MNHLLRRPAEKAIRCLMANDVVFPSGVARHVGTDGCPAGKQTMPLPEAQRVKGLPVDPTTSTTTTYDKAAIRVRRGVMGTCPVLVAAATTDTWNGQPFTV